MKTKVAMVMALTRPQRYELALAKCTELGASEFIPIITHRVLKADSTISKNRMARWKRIVKEAAELSGRVRVPPIADPAPMNSVLAQLSNHGTNSIMLWEECARTDVGALSSRHSPTALNHPPNSHLYSDLWAVSHPRRCNAQPKLARTLPASEHEFSELKPPLSPRCR